MIFFKFSLILFFIFQLGFVRATEKNKTDSFVYLAIVGPNISSTPFGQAFLLFTQSPLSRFGQKKALEGVGYQFQIRSNENDPKQLLAPLGVGKRFMIEKNRGQYFIVKYRQLGTPIIAYQLNLNEEENNRLRNLMDDEYIKRTRDKFYDFNLLRKNVLTEMLKMINSVVDSNKQFKSLWLDGPSSSLEDLLPGRLMSSLPLLTATELKDHDLVRGDPFVIPPYDEDAMRIKIFMVRSFEKIAQVCKWNKERTQFLKWLLMRKEVLYQLKFLTKLKKEIFSCGEIEAQKSWREFITYVLLVDPEGLSEEQKENILQLNFTPEEIL